MDTNKIREQFEKWALGHFVNLFGEDIIEKDFEGDYVQHNVRMAWVGWKKSREAVVVELPSEVTREAFNDESMADGFNIGLNDSRKAIETCGIKVSP